MIINRVIMQDSGICEKDIQFIQMKANSYNDVKVFDRMNTSNRGYIASSPHFDLLEMIEAQKVFITKCRSIAVARNKELLKILEDMRDDIILKEYKEQFISHIVSYCKCYNHNLYDDKDLIRFENMAQQELDAHIENVGISELDYDNPSEDAQECLSYWD